MESQLIGMLLDWGLGGIFLAFLVWQFIVSGKRQDGLSEKYEGNLEQLRAQAKQAELALRDRYDSVITQLTSEKNSLTESMREIIEKNGKKIETIEDNLNGLSLQLDGLRDTLKCISAETKGIGINVDNLVEGQKEMAQAERFRDLAKAAQLSKIRDTK